MLKKLLLGVAGVALVLGVAGTASSAQASSVTHQASTHQAGLGFLQITHKGKEVIEQRRNAPACGSVVSIFLTNAPNDVLTGHGAGNAMTIDSSSGSAYDVHCVSTGIVLKPDGTNNCVIEDSATQGSGFVITSTDCSVGRRIWTLNCGTGQKDWINTGNDFATVYTNSSNSGEKVRYIVGTLPGGAWSAWNCN